MEFEVLNDISLLQSVGRLVCLDNIIFGLQRYGGISNYWMRLASAMIDQDGFDTRFVAPKRTVAQIARPLPFSQGHLLSETLPVQLSRYLSFDTGKCPVAHTSYYRLPRQRVEKYIVTAYDFMYERYRSGPARLVHTWQKRRSLMAADVVACISSFTRDDALRLMPMLDPAKLIVIPLGVDTTEYFPDRNDAYTSFSRTVVFVGQRGGYKRFDLALGAIARVSDLTLAVVGPPMDAAEKHRAEMLIPGRWTELGPIDNDGLRRVFSAAYAFIYPSDCEGFGLPVLEAMACGCPVVCSRLGSLPEVGGDAALFAEEQDPGAYADMLRELQSDSARQSKIRSGADNVAHFTWARTIRETKLLYDL